MKKTTSKENSADDGLFKKHKRFSLGKDKSDLTTSVDPKEESES
jgi:hypothetical protein